MIKVAQISPFDFCNNKCWYCPVRYYKQPVEAIKHMSPELFERVIQQIVGEKGKTVDPNFEFIYTAHYNEIILYKYLKEMLDTLRKYSIKTMVLSNGVAITKDKVDILKEYKDVVVGVNFNIPSFEAETWAEETGNNPKFFDQVVDNVKNVFAEFGQIASVGMNGVNPEEMNRRAEVGKKLIPDMHLYPVLGLCDRVGMLIGHGIDNTAEIARYAEGKSGVSGCRNGERLEEWLHVNALGEVFSCCDDYYFKYKFGNLKDQTLAEIWGSPLHEEMKNEAKKEMCSKCAFATWE